MHLPQALAAAAALLALPAVAAEETYVLDPVHSQPQWEAGHIGFSNQHGNFGKATGKVVLDRGAHAGSIEVVIDAASVRTYDGRLDAIVKGERFFNVEKYPTIAFRSNDLSFDGERLVRARGDLTLLGITHPVVLEVANFKCGAQPFNKKPMCGAEATATIRRSEWGMTWGLELGNPGDEIKLTIPVEAYLQPAG